MSIRVFSVYDSKAGVYGQPFFMQSVGAAIRAVSDTMSNPESVWGRHPEDFSLFHIADFDELSGDLAPLKAHSSLGCLVEFIKPKAI